MLSELLLEQLPSDELLVWKHRVSLHLAERTSDHCQNVPPALQLVVY